MTVCYAIIAITDAVILLPILSSPVILSKHNRGLWGLPNVNFDLSPQGLFLGESQVSVWPGLVDGYRLALKQDVTYNKTTTHKKSL